MSTRYFASSTKGIEVIVETNFDLSRTQVRDATYYSAFGKIYFYFIPPYKPERRYATDGNIWGGLEVNEPHVYLFSADSEAQVLDLFENILDYKETYCSKFKS